MVRLCALTGTIAGPACELVVGEWFEPGREPARQCSAHRFLAFDSRSGRPAGKGVPPEYVEVRPAVAPGPRYGSSGLRGGEEPVIRIVSPPERVTYSADPDAPPETASIALEADVDPPPEQILWEVDGRPFALSDYPFRVRWPLSPGRHTFRARIPYTPYSSKRVETRVF